jgi:hypothetical protein
MKYLQLICYFCIMITAQAVISTPSTQSFSSTVSALTLSLEKNLKNFLNLHSIHQMNSVLSHFKRNAPSIIQNNYNLYASQKSQSTIPALLDTIREKHSFIQKTVQELQKALLNVKTIVKRDAGLSEESLYFTPLSSTTRHLPSAWQWEAWKPTTAWGQQLKQLKQKIQDRKEILIQQDPRLKALKLSIQQKLKAYHEKDRLDDFLAFLEDGSSEQVQHSTEEDQTELKTIYTEELKLLKLEEEIEKQDTELQNLQAQLNRLLEA